MFRLTREVRFAINSGLLVQPVGGPANSYGGYPSMTSMGRFYTAQVTVEGPLDPTSQYLLNIRDIDEAVREWLTSAARRWDEFTPTSLLLSLLDHLKAIWPKQLASLALQLTPTLSISAPRSEEPMLRLSQKFEFSASHRLHNPQLSNADNRRLFGKCNNPLGHGHNYEVQVTLAGAATATETTLAALPSFERLVDDVVIARFDHKHLNLEVAEFATLIPSVENIAKVIYGLLKPRLAEETMRLASVTVWETPKTWCEYSE